ncbi:hypothetical protein [Fibrobacter sp.]|uniref:hypothetical protein n=1 Tax=Fibrobacter sp. TaxID=35828 RepID=UPI00388FECDB
MKTASFLTGIALGAAAAVAINKKFFSKCPVCGGDAAGNPAVKEAEDAVEKLRGSVDSLSQELNKRIESEQTFAAKCEELKDQMAKQSVEIENLKNICEKQDSCNKKLEEELAAKNSV